MQVYNTVNSLIIGEADDEKLIVVEGLDGAMVVDTPDILFISSLNKKVLMKQRAL